MSCLADFTNHALLISPSVLAADFADLGRDVARAVAAGAELVHLDIMDGHFVPNISFGPGVVKALRPSCDACFDVHLMISEPGRYLDDFIKAGADHITVHVEVEEDRDALLSRIHQGGCSAGMTLRPGTPAEAIEPYMGELDMILVMTVEPGFGGQSFMSDMVPKIKTIAQMIRDSHRPIHLQVDGGIDALNAPECRAAGANILVAGSSIFRAKAGIAAAMAELRHAAEVSRQPG